MYVAEKSPRDSLTYEAFTQALPETLGHFLGTGIQPGPCSCPVASCFAGPRFAGGTISLLSSPDTPDLPMVVGRKRDFKDQFLASFKTGKC